jgi:DNA ligase-4
MPPPPVPQTQVKEEEADPATAAWFASSNVKPKNTRSTEDSATESDTATEPDSDNEDVKEEDNDWDVVGSIESEFQTVDGQVRRSTVCEEVLSAYGFVQEAAPHQLEIQKAETQDEGPVPQLVMGETDDAMEYDTELIFKHLYVWRSKTVHGLTM